MATYEVHHNEINSTNLESLAMQLVCGCLSDRNQWRIIIDSDGTSLKNYFMVDFSNCGEPFEPGIACIITRGGSDYDQCPPSNDECLRFGSIFAALPVIASLMSLNELSYIESF